MLLPSNESIVTDSGPNASKAPVNGDRVHPWWEPSGHQNCPVCWSYPDEAWDVCYGECGDLILVNDVSEEADARLIAAAPDLLAAQRPGCTGQQIEVTAA